MKVRYVHRSIFVISYIKQNLVLGRKFSFATIAAKLKSNKKHGTIIQTGITWKKIPCYMCDSTCRLLIVKKDKIF